MHCMCSKVHQICNVTNKQAEFSGEVFKAKGYSEGKVMRALPSQPHAGRTCACAEKAYILAMYVMGVSERLEEASAFQSKIKPSSDSKRL